MVIMIVLGGNSGEGVKNFVQPTDYLKLSWSNLSILYWIHNCECYCWSFLYEYKIN